jgi:putative Ig domain-containing protein/PKD domain-containing protein
VAPVLAAIGNKSVNEEALLSFTATATDADVPANTLSFSLVGAPAGASITSAGVFNWTPTEAQGPGNYTFTVKVSDNGVPAMSDEESITVHVDEVNKAPVVAAIAPQTVNEASTASFTATASDPDLPANTLAFSLVGAPAGATINSATGAFSWTPADDDPSVTPSDGYTFKVRATDNGTPALYGETSVTITVNNVTPVLAALSGPINPTAVGSSVSVSASFTDIGTKDTHTGIIDWGDGTTSAAIVESNGSGTASGSHAYSSANVYTIKLTVTDDDAGSSNQSMYQYAVIYDPSAGFVTGGGWIDSPLGAYRADPSLTGKANFGFVAKYQKGKSVPEGNTEFQFKAGNLNFKSTLYEWLVISGIKGQYKGYGTINGAGNYRFVLTIEDGDLKPAGGPDKFRIRIWGDGSDLGGSGLVYDNQYLDTALGDATTVLGGGSLVIHSDTKTASK